MSVYQPIGLVYVVHFEPIFLSESSLVEFGIWGYAALNLEVWVLTWRFGGVP